MKRTLLLLLAFLAISPVSWAASTINATNPYSYGANIGWMNWRPSAADGVTIGEFVCSGWIYGANVGWINIGDGTPDNNIQYSNASATDFGVNYTIDPTLPGRPCCAASPTAPTSAGSTSRTPAIRGCVSPMADSKATPIPLTAAGSIWATAPSRSKPTLLNRHRHRHGRDG